MASVLGVHAGEFAAARRLRIAYVYRNFNDAGSIHTSYRRNAERLAEDEDVTAFCSEATRTQTEAPLRFERVEPIIRGRGRLAYALETATFASRAAAHSRRLRDRFEIVHALGFATYEADLVSVHAVRPAEQEHYWTHIEPAARLRRRLHPVLRPQSLAVKSIERRLYKGPTPPLCICPTKRIADDLRHWYGVPKELVEVIPLGTSVRRFGFDAFARARLRQQMSADDERLVLLFVGDDFDRKGLETAITGLALARSECELWVVGDGSRRRYAHLAASLGVADRIRFIGRIGWDAIPDWFSACDVVVLPSKQDSWGHTVIEGMAAGRPVVASEYTGAHEVLTHGLDGYVLSESGTAEELTTLLDGPLADARVRGAVGERAVRRVAEFDHDRVYGAFRAAHHQAFELRCARRRQARE